MTDLGVGTDSPNEEAAGLEAAPDAELRADTGGAPSGMAYSGAGSPPMPQDDLRSPELIEAGMVYVDPDPEIGAPPHAVGWAEQPAARQSLEDPGASSDGADTPAEAVDVVGAQEVVEEAAVPWKEPALPMALPPGMTPPDPGERPASLNEDLEDGDLVPEPDPTWPKLFGQSAERQEAGGPAEVAGGEDPTASVDQMGDERDAEASPDRPAVPEVGEQSAVVDITSQEPRAAGGSEKPSQPDHVGDEGTDAQHAVDHANVSVAVQQAENEGGEVDLRETPANPRSVDVSRETSAGGGGGMDPAVENEGLEDEAAVAVREAVTRAAAEAGVDVSREAEPSASEFSIDDPGDELSIDPEAAARSARVTFRIDRDTLNGDRRVVAVANQKGGVGKSTTAVNIGAYLALAGARVLVVDLDPQGNASTGLGLDHREIEPSIYDVLTGEASPAAAIRPTGVANLHVLPSTIDLAGAEVELVSAMSRETRLRRALESVDHQYDSILIDCPPSLGLLTVNALAAADELLIPIQCEYYALEGLGQLLRNVELVRTNLNPDLRIGGIVLTMYDGRTRLALQVVDEVRKHFTDVVYQTVVPRSVRLSEAPGYGLPIALYDPLSRGGIAYRDLTFELAERSGLLAPTEEGAS
jgi:chromosome partitioning protein